MQHFQQAKLEFTKRIITDPVLIKKYDEEFNYEFYTPEVEHDWIDTEIVVEHRYTEAREAIGTELSPIYVAVNDKDEDIDDPILRIHGRLIDGRQRYEDSKTIKKRWGVCYVYIKDYDEWLSLIPSMGSQKSQDVIATQTKAIVLATCHRIWKKKPKEIFDSNGEPRKDKVSAVVTEQLKIHWSKRTILKYIPKMYKEQYRIDNVMKRDNTPKKVSKIQQENMRLKNENDNLIEKNSELETRVLPQDKKDKMISKQESDIKQLKTAIGTARTELKKLWMKQNIDKKDEDFEDYLISLGIVKRMYND